LLRALKETGAPYAGIAASTVDYNIPCAGAAAITLELNASLCSGVGLETSVVRMLACDYDKASPRDPP